jgi:hypothetical protein
MSEQDEILEDQDGDSEVIKKLRAIARQASEKDKNISDLQGQINELTTANLITGANLGTLNERQLKALKNEMANEEDLNSDKVKEIAKELGYVTEPPPGDESSSTQEPPPNVVDVLNAQSIVDTANAAAAAGGPDTKDFNEKMKEIGAKVNRKEITVDQGRDQLRALIRAEGQKNRIMHEYDTV